MVCGQRHFFDLFPVLIILVLESNRTVINVNQSVIRYRHAMSVPPNVIDHFFRPGKGLFGIDNPLFVPHLTAKIIKIRRLFDTLMVLDIVVRGLKSIRASLPEFGDRMSQII